jgi:hypothetical protein
MSIFALPFHLLNAWLKLKSKFFAVALKVSELYPKNAHKETRSRQYSDAPKFVQIHWIANILVEEFAFIPANVVKKSENFAKDVKTHISLSSLAV